MTNELQALHETAVRLSKEYTEKGIELFDVITKVFEKKLFEQLGFASLFEYCTQSLKLSESQAYMFNSLTKKTQEVPKLKEFINDNRIHLTNARRILPVLTVENQDTWLPKAAELSQRELEKEIVKAQPEALKVLRLIFKLEAEEQLKRAQDVACKKFKKAVSLEDTINHAIAEFLEKHDPLKKAERHLKLVARRKIEAENKPHVPVSQDCHAASPLATTGPVIARNEVTRQSRERSRDVFVAMTMSSECLQFIESLPKKRKYIPAEVRHVVNLRDQGQCTFRTPDGKRCQSQRWVDSHHLKLVSHGGSNSAENLATLCSEHHRKVHVG